ncbi:hypothetical protein TBLA_0C03190 [Henningerozyma blattae CBS 6284]|uniref:Phosphatidic acid phosphatase type 2/haloperoxidase domain-containing protein n=1 Tax=Henningerozyma blattae (strain ATCC 34711 / CBS 6284 / DSM 70876 / NBRC 10599 / NRRL Y-10934 / UCD 77-7) TaxID=1071380 RepID=I2H171_HENB6|nr:hypothetical protein TBLA_0C03190 [Tetrapisispora blattae CBS 6284]CCH60123.1 hypothetical protein TBLA_0C03190 [Tetrapisispora blattae CBS 6284]
MVILDRFTLNLPLATSHNITKWKVNDLFVLIVLVILNVFVYRIEPFQRQFLINDITLNHPFKDPQQVSDLDLFVYSLIIPIGIICFIVLLLANTQHRWYLLYISLLGQGMAFIATCLFSNFIKNYIGRCRPDFIVRCQPSMDALPNVYYRADDICLNPDRSVVLEGYRTTPSGHSCESFAGLTFLSYWIAGQLIIWNNQLGIWRKIISWLPLLGASLIALTRTQDYRHHFVDVIIGAIMGWFIAKHVYRLYFPSINSINCFKPLLDDSQVLTPQEALSHDMAQADEFQLERR